MASRFSEKAFNNKGFWHGGVFLNVLRAASAHPANVPFRHRWGAFFCEAIRQPTAGRGHLRFFSQRAPRLARYLLIFTWRRLASETK